MFTLHGITIFRRRSGQVSGAEPSMFRASVGSTLLFHSPDVCTSHHVQKSFQKCFLLSEGTNLDVIVGRHAQTDPILDDCLDFWRYRGRFVQ